MSCGPAATSTVFVPPTESIPTLILPTSTPVPLSISTTPTVSVTVGPCSNDLKFVDDVTIKDGTIVTPGSIVDKQWLVTNSGTCNWDSTYRLKLINGDALGATAEQSLYPARAGTQATLRIVFTAPTEAGTYHSAWQAFAPDGSSFGDAVYMTINVSQ